MVDAVDLLRKNPRVRDAYERAGAVFNRLDSRSGPYVVTERELTALFASKSELGAGANEICRRPGIPILTRAAISSVVWPERLSSDIELFKGFDQLAAKVRTRERSIEVINDRLHRPGVPILVARSLEQSDDYEYSGALRYAVGRGDGRGLAFHDVVHNDDYCMVAMIGIRDMILKSSPPPSGITLEGVVHVGVSELVRVEESDIDEVIYGLVGEYPNPRDRPVTQEYFSGEAQVGRMILELGLQ